MLNFIKKRWFLLLLAAIILFVIFNFINQRRNPAATTYDPAKDRLVSVEIKDLQQNLTLSGNIDALSRADVRFQTGGRLSWVGVKEGDKVRKWQALASLDRAELRKQLEKNFNDYRSQFSQFQDTQDQYKTIKENNNLTDEMRRILERSQYGLNNSVIAYELTDLSIKYATIVSPLEGVVVAADPTTAGLNITPASATYTIIDPNSIYFRSEIDQEDVSRIHIGQKATVRLDSFPDAEFNTTVATISFTPIPGRSSIVYAVRLDLDEDNSDLKYRLGMDGDALITLSQVDNALSVDSDALIEEEDGQYLLVKNPTSNQLEKKAVKIGIETDNEIQILEGVSENDQIVIKNN